MKEGGRLEIGTADGKENGRVSVWGLRRGLAIKEDEIMKGEEMRGKEIGSVGHKERERERQKPRTEKVSEILIETSATLESPAKRGVGERGA